jgi:ParB-like chromosome segregation protein Spo0J
MTTTDTSTPTITGKCHPACLLLPEMTADEFRELVEDLRNHGQRHPIIVDAEGVILDGRHRYLAIQQLFLEPRVQTFQGDEREKAALVMSENVHRRHLTTQQRAAIAAELATMKSGTRTDLASNGAKSEMSDADAAKVMHVSERSVERAKARMRIDPDSHAKAKAGTLKKRKQPQSAPQRMRRQWDAIQKAKPEPVEGVDYKVVEDQWGFKHREPVGATANGSIMSVIREGEDLLVQMAAVAHAAENGDVNALKKIVEGGKQVIALMAKLCEAEPTATANGADQSEQSTEPDSAADPQNEQRISPRTNKPVRKYVRRSAA